MGGLENEGDESLHELRGRLANMKCQLGNGMIRRVRFISCHLFMRECSPWRIRMNVG